jgi:hypothetical protein
VNLIDRDAVIDKLVYTASNAVADHLVDRVHHWPEVNGLAAPAGCAPTARDPPAALLPTRRQHWHRDALPYAMESVDAFRLLYVEANGLLYAEEYAMSLLGAAMAHEGRWDLIEAVSFARQCREVVVVEPFGCDDIS